MTTTSVQIGSTLGPDHGWSSGPVDNGNYYALLKFNESRSFGPIRIVRRSQTVKNFSIKK